VRPEQKKALFSVIGFIAIFFALWGLGDIALPKTIPGGAIIQGLIIGGLFSLPAMGLVLVYRSARIINFAQMEIGGLAGAVAVALMLGNHVSFAIACLAGIGSAILVGVLIDRIIIWRFQNAPRLILTVATIGVMQILGAIEYEIPNLYPQGAFQNPAKFSVPFSFTKNVSGFVFDGNSLLAAIVVPVVALLLWLFVSKTDLGAGIRACADSSERALLLGIPVRMLSLITWVVASVLSAIGWILSQHIIGFSIGQPLGPQYLIFPLAAAAIGRFESLPITLAASLILGAFRQSVFFSTSNESISEVGFVIVIFLALALQRQNYTKVWESGLGAFKAVAEVRPLPDIVSKTTLIRVLKIALAVAGLLIFVVLPAFNTSLSSANHMADAVNIAIYAVVAVSLVVLTGWAGQLSFGQFGIAAAGSSATAVALMSWHLNVALAILFAIPVGIILSLVIGIPALRLPGLNLAVMTFAFAQLMYDYFLNSANIPVLSPPVVNFTPLFGRIDLTSQRALYYVCLVVVVLTALGARNLAKSRTGRIIKAIRDNERAGAAYGASPLRAKLVAFSYSGAAAGIAGALYVISLRQMSQGAFLPDYSINVFTMVVVGGMASLLGGISGAILFGVISIAAQSSPAWEYFSSGAVFLIILYFLPQGISGVIYQIRDYLIRNVFFKKLLDEHEQVQPERPSSVIPGPAHEAALRLTALEELEVVSKQTRHQQTVQAGNPESAMLGCLDVDAGYGRSQILYGVSVAVAPGEILALLGTNGAGKSTLLRVFSGLLKPKHGEVYFNAQPITNLSTLQRVQRGLIMVPGGRGVFGSLTVEENLRLAAWMYKRDKEFVRSTLTKVFTLFPALSKRAKVKASMLSGGEQQMLTLSQALFCKPKVLLIDELSLGLAPTVVAELLNAVRAMAREGVTIVIVEQSVNVATAIANRAVFMERGQVRFSGPTPSVEQQPNLLRSVFLRAASKAATRIRSEHEAQRMVDRQSITAFGVVNVSKRFGSVSALEDVSISVSKGEILGIIGANGAGKTTLFDVCSGFLDPDSGRVVMEGVNITPLAPYQRAIRGLGRVFQDAQLFPSMTVKEVLSVALERHVEVKDPLAGILGLAKVAESERKIDARVEELIELMGLGRWRNSFVSELSTGTRRVVDLACAMAHRPRVLLLDEPSAGMAQRESEAMGELLLGLRAETGATFLVIEHDVPLVSYVSDRLVCLHLGQVIAEGQVTAVLENPAVISAYLGRDEAAIQRSTMPGAPAGVAQTQRTPWAPPQQPSTPA
jgi:ABC-type branched-subunit amino acid transport system ATPase component/ABC-type branched-subunit amino acid transport system permease subunit